MYYYVRVIKTYWKDKMENKIRKCTHGNKVGEDYDICEDCILDSQFGAEV